MTKQPTPFEQAEDASRQARYADAIHLYQQELMDRERALGSDHRDLAPLLTAIGETWQTLGQFPAAEAVYRRVLAICEREYGPGTAQTALALGDVAGIRDEVGDDEQAEQLYQQALTLSQAQGLDSSDTALAYSKLARFYRSRHKYDQAEPLYQQAVAIYEKRPEGETAHMATCLNNFAVLFLETSRPAQAESVLRKAIRIRTVISGDEHPAIAASFKNMGRVYRAQGDMALAKIMYQRALAIYEQKLGIDHPDVLAILELFATLPNEEAAHDIHKGQ